jgi:hypothetical protein
MIAILNLSILQPFYLNVLIVIRNVWRYESGNLIRSRKSKKDWQHNDQMKKDKRTNNDLQSITLKTKNRATRTTLKLMCSGRVSSSCSTCGTRCVTLVTILVISHEWGKDRIVITTSGTYLCHLWHRYSVTVNQVMVATRKTFKVMTPYIWFRYK